MDKSRLSAEATRVGEAKKRLSCLTSSPLSPVDSEDGEEGGQEGLKKSNRFDFIFKIVLIGDATSGKTSLMRRYVDDTFNHETMTTIGVDFTVKTLVVNGSTVKLQIWDTAGQERFAPIGSMYYHGAKAVIFTYDITQKRTFDGLPMWRQKFEERNEGTDCVRVLVGCKADLEEEREVAASQGQKAAEEMESRWSETSALTGSNVDLLFLELTQEMLSKRQVYGPSNGVHGPSSNGVPQAQSLTPRGPGEGREVLCLQQRVESSFRLPKGASLRSKAQRIRKKPDCCS